MKLRNKKTGMIGELHYEPEKEIHFTVVTEDPFDVEIHRTLAGLNAEWEDYKPAEPQLADDMAREIIKKWYNKNKIVGKLCSYGSGSWLGLRGSDKSGCDWKIELHVSYNSMLKDDKLYTLTELIGEEEE